MTDTAVAQTEPTGINIELVITEAVKSGNLDTVKELMSVRRELRDEWARAQYYTAMAAFQSECPVIIKDTEVLNKDGKSVRYRFAKLDSIVSQAGPLIAKNGFSWSIKTTPTDGVMQVQCVVTHSAGHSETSTFSTIIDEGAFMTDSQKGGSASSFGKRYAFCNAFGIMTGDQDDDAQSFEQGCDKLLRMMKVARDNWTTIAEVKDSIATEDLSRAIEAWRELSEDEMKALWVAPTKGGIFTTKEREVMKSDEWGSTARSML